MRPKVVRTDRAMEVLGSRLAELEALAHVITTPDDREETLIEAVTDADVLLVSGARITRAVFQAATRLRALIKWGVGVDSLDIPAATELGIPIVHCPFYGPQSIADFSFALLIALAKKLFLIDRDMHTKGWMFPEPLYLQIDLPGKTVGLVGLGRIGRVMARRCQGFDMQVIAYDPYVGQTGETVDGVTFVPLNELMQRADFVSLHAILTAETEKLVGAEQIGLMKPSAYLINTSRGAITDEAALFTALKENKIAGAGLDVFAIEPNDLNNPFLSLENTIVAPHLASYTPEAYDELDIDMLNKVKAVLAGDPLWDVKNPEVFERK